MLRQTMEQPANVPKSGWAVQMAKASWCCPVIIWVLMFVARRSISRLILDLIAAVLMVAGFVLGIVALFGIPKNGTKGILAPAIVGIAFNSLLMFIFVTNFMAARARHGE